MATLNSNSLDKWRDYFRMANSDIFDIIEHSIIVAATDCPKEFRIRRDGIAEVLFSCKLTKCLGCDLVQPVVPAGGGGGREEAVGGVEGYKFEMVGGSKGSKVNSSGEDDGDGDDDEEEEAVGNEGERNVNEVSNYSYDVAEALSDEIEEEAEIIREVLRIKEIVENSEIESDSVLLESLRKLQLMALSMDMLKATEVGKAVNPLRKHASREIRHLARTLVKDWMAVVDEWAKARPPPVVGVASEATPESMNPSVLDEEIAFPSPPYDDLHTFDTTIMFSKVLDDFDDFGNPRNSGELSKYCEADRRPSLENKHNIPQRKPQQLPNEPSVVSPKENKAEQTKKQEALVKKQSSVVKPYNSAVAQSGPGRPVKPNLERRSHNLTKIQQKPEDVTVARKPLASQRDKIKCLDDAEDSMKLEAAKRRLQERYQEAQNAKRQRTIQFMELQDLPKQSLGRKNPHMKPTNKTHHNRQRPIGRR